MLSTSIDRAKFPISRSPIAEIFVERSFNLAFAAIGYSLTSVKLRSSSGRETRAWNEPKLDI